MALRTATQTFTVAVSVPNPPLGTDPWVSATNSLASDDLYAEVLGGGISYFLYITKGNITSVVSPDSIIQGIAAKTEVKTGVGTFMTNQSVVDGTGTGDVRSITIGTGETVYTAGSTSDMWGLAFTANTVTAANFGMRLVVSDEQRGDPLSVDYFYLEITHEPGRMIMCV